MKYCGWTSACELGHNKFEIPLNIDFEKKIFVIRVESRTDFVIPSRLCNLIMFRFNSIKFRRAKQNTIVPTFFFEHYL